MICLDDYFTILKSRCHLSLTPLSKHKRYNRLLTNSQNWALGWSERILPDTRGSQLPAQSGQRKSTATLTDVKPSCSFLAMRLTSASLRGLGLVRLIESKKTAGLCWSEEPGSSSTRHCGIGRLKLSWRHISQTGMQPLGIIHLLNEHLQIGLGVGKRLILLQIHLLLL